MRPLPFAEIRAAEFDVEGAVLVGCQGVEPEDRRRFGPVLLELAEDQHVADLEQCLDLPQQAGVGRDGPHRFGRGDDRIVVADAEVGRLQHGDAAAALPDQRHHHLQVPGRGTAQRDDVGAGAQARRKYVIDRLQPEWPLEGRGA